MFGLEYILRPVSTEEFLDQYKGKKALHITGEESKFENLYGWEDINHVVNKSRPSYEGMLLVHETNSLPRHELQNLSNWLAKGATLVINSVQTIDPIAEQFGEILANDMNSSVNINCYVSFPAKQGFDCHYDTHDVFIVQTSGVKKWYVFEPTRQDPLDRDPDFEKQLYE